MGSTKEKLKNFQCSGFTLISYQKDVCAYIYIYMLQQLQILGCRHVRQDVVNNCFWLMTLSYQQLFVINDCFET